MIRTRVKICGFTRAEDAVQASMLGADAVGLVFYPPSPRNVSIDVAAEVIDALPAFVTTVGLFVDEGEAFIEKVLEQLPLDCLQFHGDESAEYCRTFKKPYMKAFRMKPGFDVQKASEKYFDASALLLDAYHPGIQGGSGCQFDWGMIPSQLSLPIVLAGGLNTKNVKDAITTVRPYAVDVSSGVEIKKGFKDADKMAAFMREIKEGDRTI